MKIKIVIYIFIFISSFITAQKNAIIIQYNDDNNITMSVYSNDNFQQYKLSFNQKNRKYESPKIESFQSFIKNTGVYTELKVKEDVNELIKKIDEGAIYKDNLVLIIYNKNEVINKKFVEEKIFKFVNKPEINKETEIFPFSNILLGVIVFLNLIILIILFLKGRKSISKYYKNNMQPDIDYLNYNSRQEKNVMKTGSNKEHHTKPADFDSIEIQLTNIAGSLEEIKSKNTEIYDIQFINKSAGTTHFDKIKELMINIIDKFTESQENINNHDYFIKNFNNNFAELKELLSELPNKINIPKTDLSPLINSVEELKKLITVSDNKNSSKYEGF